MAFIGCDVCGGGLALSADGAYAVCERCGVKHDRARMQQKAQDMYGRDASLETAHTGGAVAAANTQQAELQRIRGDIEKALNAVPKVFRKPLLEGKGKVGWGNLIFRMALELAVIVILDVLYAFVGRPYLLEQTPEMALAFRIFMLVLMLGLVCGMVKLAIQFALANRQAAKMRQLREDEARIQNGRA